MPPPACWMMTTPSPPAPPFEDVAGEHTATFKIAEGVENPTAIDYKGEKIFCAFFPAAGVTWNKDEGKFIFSEIFNIDMYLEMEYTISIKL